MGPNISSIGTDTAAPQIELMKTLVESNSSNRETNETLLHIIDEQNKAIKLLFESNQQLITEVTQLKNEIKLSQEVKKKAVEDLKTSLQGENKLLRFSELCKLNSDRTSKVSSIYQAELHKEVDYSYYYTDCNADPIYFVTPAGGNGLKATMNRELKKIEDNFSTLTSTINNHASEINRLKYENQLLISTINLITK